MKHWILAVMVWMAIAAVARGAELTEKDNGQTIQLQPGGDWLVALDGNPTTGYTWEVAACDLQVLKMQGEPEYQRGSELIGGGGRYRFHFQAVAEGKTKLSLVYHRSWEKDTPPAKTFEVEISVGTAEVLPTVTEAPLSTPEPEMAP